MDSIQDVEKKRDLILEQLRAMRSLRRGTINEQFFKGTRKNDSEPVVRGPYYVISRREGNKTVSKRLKKGPQLEQARSDVAEHKRFVDLCRELEKLTEQLGEMIRAEETQEKKRKRRPSSKTKS